MPYAIFKTKNGVIRQGYGLHDRLEHAREYLDQSCFTGENMPGFQKISQDKIAVFLDGQIIYSEEIKEVSDIKS